MFSSSCLSFFKKLKVTSSCLSNDDNDSINNHDTISMTRRWRYGRRRRRKRNNKKVDNPESKKTIKLALLIGILYTGTSDELGGCINDILKIKKLLIEKMGYEDKHIVLLHDEQKDQSLQPTGKNIINQLNILLSKSLKKSSPRISDIFIHFSGHGAYIKDDRNDESDGKDELIVPLDYETGGVITDDYLTY